MPANELLECSFLMPRRRDPGISSGGEQPDENWRWLEAKLLELFEGATPDRGELEGFYRDPDSGKVVVDQSYRYTVAVETERVDELKDLLREAGVKFKQKSIYLSVAGKVVFVEPPNS